MKDKIVLFSLSTHENYMQVIMKEDVANQILKLFITKQLPDILGNTDCIGPWAIKTDQIQAIQIGDFDPKQQQRGQGFRGGASGLN